MATDEDVVYAILQAEKACEWGELKARAFKISKGIVTKKRVFDASMELERQGKAASIHAHVKCKFPPSKPPLFRYSMSVDPTQRIQTILYKGQLLANHYDNTKVIGAHAEQLVKKVCRDLDYPSKIWLRKKVGTKKKK